MILDEAGELVWFRPLRGDEQAFDFRAQTYRGEARADVVAGPDGRSTAAPASGRIVDSAYRPVATVRAANGYEMDAHELKLTPAGTALAMSYFVVPWDLSKLGGRRDGLVEDNVVQEIDVETGRACCSSGTRSDRSRSASRTGRRRRSAARSTTRGT